MMRSKWQEIDVQSLRISESTVSVYSVPDLVLSSGTVLTVWF